MTKMLSTKKRIYDLQNQTLVMGILNVTPDSFSDGGHFDEIAIAVEHAKALESNGAHIIDVGGESTRPGHVPVTIEEEIERVIPVINAIKKYVSVPISIDTYKAEVARLAIEAGATIINDVWGAKREPEIAKVASEYNVPIILMHNRDNKNYEDLLTDIKKDLQESINLVKKAGVPDENIILDPGIGFAKTSDDNLLVLRRLDELKIMGYPLLLGTSRKSFIGKVLDLPVEERLEGTGATICYGISKGADIIRVHDVKEMARMVKMMDSIVGKGVVG